MYKVKGVAPKRLMSFLTQKKRLSTINTDNQPNYSPRQVIR